MPLLTTHFVVSQRMLLVVLCLVCSVSRSSVDYESLFFEDVHVEQLVDYDGGHEFLEVSSSGLPQHRHEGNFESQELVLRINLQGESTAYRDRGVHYGGSSLAASGPIGVAVNGVPIFPYVDRDGIDLVKPPPEYRNRSATAHDGCLGFREPMTGAYIYRTAPPCLYGDERGAYASLAATMSLGYGKAISPEEFPATKARQIGAASRGPILVGVMLDGFPLWGPCESAQKTRSREGLGDARATSFERKGSLARVFCSLGETRVLSFTRHHISRRLDGNGLAHEGLDECNGKYDSLGRYAYYATDHAPYTIRDIPRQGGTRRSWIEHGDRQPLRRRVCHVLTS